MKKEVWLYGTAFVSGILVWVLGSLFSGQTEAWDSEPYLSVGIPALCLVAGVLGFIDCSGSRASGLDVLFTRGWQSVAAWDGCVWSLCNSLDSGRWSWCIDLKF